MRKIATVMTIVAGLAVLAAPAVAQVGTEVGERPAFQGRGMMMGISGARHQNPGALLIERRAELGLTAEQVRQIEAIRDRVTRENAARLEQLRQQNRDRMEPLQAVRRELRETNRAAGQEIHGLLTEEQRQQLHTLRREQVREFRGQRGGRGDGEWQGRRGDRRGDGEGRRPHRGHKRGGG
jgi:hypothetical protein